MYLHNSKWYKESKTVREDEYLLAKATKHIKLDLPM